jgi:uncharacterized membrane protein YkoI
MRRFVMENKENRQLEEALLRAFTAQTPDNFDAILADCQKKNKKESKSIMKKNFVRAFVAVAAVFVMIFSTVFAMQLLGNSVLTTVAIDVNPSIEIELDKNEKVVSVSAVNEDATAIINGLDLKSKGLEEAVTLIVEAMVEKGYISELSNSILVSISGDDERSEALREKVAGIIKSMLDEGSIEGSVLSQTHIPDEEVKALAEKYNISEGKAELIAKLVAADGTHLFEELAGLSVNELNILLEKVGANGDELNKQGNASTKSYVEKEAALAAALGELGVTEADVKGIEIELDYEHGMMVYEVEFKLENTEYEYEINATDASIVRVEIDTDDDADDDDDGDDDDDALPPEAIITEADAKKVALTDAGVNADEVISFRTELDEDDGVWCYEIRFKTATAKYNYDINAEDGSIVNKKIKTDSEEDEKQEDDDDKLPELPENVIAPEEAIEVALTHAGVSAEAAKKLEAELDADDGTLYYEVEFKADGFEYEYKISATDKSILRFEKDSD